eukprot:GILJ01001892.1.p1 GENE.GILJ01001892.1~~GILJ01001892.1.p1  ORF type:complete len:234 (-),score=22.20 GILJ01001892.1:113-814(-)
MAESDEVGRITFPRNPWASKGHGVAGFEWTGRINKKGELYFDFHLQSDNYYQDGPGDSAGDGAWHSTTGWNNFHTCILSSVHWPGHKGILAGDSTTPFDFKNNNPLELIADPLDSRDKANPAFGIYLLGFDTVAEHKMTIRPTSDNEGFRGDCQVDWTGKIALCYLVHTDFDYEFKLNIHHCSLGRITFSEDVKTKAAAKILLEKCVVNGGELFNISSVDGRFVAKWIGARQD